MRCYDCCIAIYLFHARSSASVDRARGLGRFLAFGSYPFLTLHFGPVEADMLSYFGTPDDHNEKMRRLAHACQQWSPRAIRLLYVTVGWTKQPIGDAHLSDHSPNAWYNHECLRPFKNFTVMRDSVGSPIPPTHLLIEHGYSKVCHR
jgi:hypothetical protein